MQAIGVLPALLGVLAQSFDSGYRMAIRLRRQQRTRRDRHPIKEHRTCAAFARLAPVLDAEDAVTPQRVEQ